MIHGRYAHQDNALSQAIVLRRVKDVMTGKCNLKQSLKSTILRIANGFISSAFDIADQASSDLLKE